MELCCYDCSNYWKEGHFCGYEAEYCRVYGCFDAIEHPHSDCIATNCDCYKTTRGLYMKDSNGNYVRIKE